MNIFYTPTEKEVLNARNNIFKQKGMPALLNNGFSKSPYKSSWYGKDEMGDYSYLHCKLIGKSIIIHLKTHIIKGDMWIKNYLNVFELRPEITSLNQLTNFDGINYWIPPSSLTRMRLKIDGYQMMPIIRDLIEKQHRIGSFYTKSGFGIRLDKFGNLIEYDFNNINFFIKKWHEFHKPNVTDWEGNIISRGYLNTIFST